MEIMGLAIIIILVALAVLFAVSIMISREPSGIKKVFYHKKMADNTVYTLLATTTECRFLSIEQLLADCAEGGVIECAEGDSCAYAGRLIDDLLKETLGDWNINYHMAVDMPNMPDIEFGEKCLGERSSSELYPIPSRAGQLTARLEICS